MSPAKLHLNRGDTDCNSFILKKKTDSSLEKIEPIHFTEFISFSTWPVIGNYSNFFRASWSFSVIVAAKHFSPKAVGDSTVLQIRDLTIKFLEWTSKNLTYVYKLITVVLFKVLPWTSIYPVGRYNQYPKYSRKSSFRMFCNILAI